MVLAIVVACCSILLCLVIMYSLVRVANAVNLLNITLNYLLEETRMMRMVSALRKDE